MTWFRRRRDLEAEVDAEFEHHREMKRRALMAEGASPAEAGRASRIAMGSAAWKEDTRAQWTFARIEAFGDDLRYALRMLAKDRLFTAIAVATLALGIGATTAVFSLLYGLLWRPLAIAQPEELVRISLGNLGPDTRLWLDGRAVVPKEMPMIAYPMYEALARRADPVFDGIFGVGGGGGMHVEFDGVPQRARVSTVTGSFFRVTGVRPQAGRFFADSSDVQGGVAGESWPAVISDEYWEKQFGRSPAAIGAKLTIERAPFVVVGAAPRGFTGTSPGAEFDFWIPLSANEAMFPTFRWRTARDSWTLRTFARRKDGVTLHQVNRHLEGVRQAVLEESIDPARSSERRDSFMAMKIEAHPASSGFSWLSTGFVQPLYILLGAVAAVLLIAATNLTRLFFARATARGHELAVRLSLGAPPGRIRRELLLESALVAGTGAAAGLLLSRWFSGAMQTAAFAGNVRVDTSIDAWMLGFVALVLPVTALVAGLAPAMTASRVDPRGALKSRAAGPASLRTRGGLIVLQTGLSLALAGGAGIMGATLRQLLNEATGLDTRNTMYVAPDLINAGVPRASIARTYENVLGEVRALPETIGAAWIMWAPLSGNLATLTVEVPGRADLTPRQREVMRHQTGDGYFAAAGIPIVAGSDLPPAATGRKNVVVLSEAAARRFHGSAAQAVGQSIRIGKLPLAEIVGVAADAAYNNIRDPRPATVYLPYWNENVSAGMNLAVRYRGSEASMKAAVTRILTREAGREPYVRVTTIEGNLRDSVRTERLIAGLLTGLAALAVLISAAGLAALLSYMVEQRRRDLGIRLALGATASRIRGEVLRLGLTLTGGGIALGAALGLGARRSLDSFAYGISAADPRVWLAAAATLVLAALAASLWPAWRASRIDPARTLRNE